MIAPMEVGRADGAFLLHVGDFAVGVDVLIAADDAAAIECGESEETNDAHTTTLAVGLPTGVAMVQQIAASRRGFRPMPAVLQSMSQLMIARMTASLVIHRSQRLRNYRDLGRLYVTKCGDMPRNVTWVDPFRWIARPAE